MKLTKKRLKQIIKEELENIQNESAAFLAARAATKGPKLIRKSDGDMLDTIERDVQDMVSYIKQKLNPEAIDVLMQQLAGAAGEKTMREYVQQEGMDIPTAEKIMQMDNCADLRNLVDDLEKSGRAYKGRVPTHEYLVAEKRYDELCLSTLSRNPDDPGYYPPGFLEENKDDA